MGKGIVKIVFLILVFIGIGSGIFITAKRKNDESEKKARIEAIFSEVQQKPATLTKVYTYGDTLNIEGKISNISEDNFESAKLIITDGTNEKSIMLDASVGEDKVLNFSTEQINNAIELDSLDLGNYYVLFRLKLNNSSVAKKYFLAPSEKISEIEYYTVTKNSQNKKINIGMLSRKIDEKNYDYLSVKVMNAELPENVYDFVIDAGHGGKDVGERSRNTYRSRYDFRICKKFKGKP